MKRSILLVTCFLFAGALGAQVTDAEKLLKKHEKDSIVGWRSGGVFSVNFTQSSYTNWASGGQDAIAMNSNLSLFGDYSDSLQSWDNSLDLAYGLQKQNGFGWIKTDDKIEFVSKYGRGITDSWHYAGLVQLRSQFTPGYNYPNDSVRISDFLSPGYAIAALGFDYKPSKKLTAFLAPLTGKLTTVMDQRLANNGAFGVEPATYDTSGNVVTPGENFRVELGGYLRVKYNTKIMENISLMTKLDLFSNYLNNPQNIDVNWETLISFKVNSHISASITTHLIYDHDIDIEVDNDNDGVVDAVGPRTQFKEVLAIGFVYRVGGE